MTTSSQVLCVTLLWQSVGQTGSSKAGLGDPELVTDHPSSGTLRGVDGGSPGKNIWHDVPSADPDVEVTIS